jgi:ferredoxin-NADP reductase
LRELKKRDKLTGNRLFFSNRTEDDIILADELKSMLGRDALFLVNGQESYHYDNRFIDEAFLKDELNSLNRYFYICGPDLMTAQISKILVKLGVAPDLLVFER